MVIEGSDPGPVMSARAVGLRYVRDGEPGLSRRRRGRGFSYRGIGGAALRDRDALARIRALAIPPAWRDVWICPHPDGHLQATGRDAKGRKQYRYHPRWRHVRDDVKYGRMLAFGAALPVVRAATAANLRLAGLPRERVLAAIVQLLEKTFIRVGNEEYARANRSFGLTTMRDRHVEVNGSSLVFEFRAKSGVPQVVDLRDPRLARTVKRCQELPGQARGPGARTARLARRRRSIRGRRAPEPSRTRRLVVDADGIVIAQMRE